MKIRHLLVLALIMVIGCAPYKQLKPVPELSPAEKGFIELKKEGENFLLKKEKQYFIAFPPPAEKNWYLVLDITNKQKIGTAFTAELVKKKTVGPKIKDESLKPENLSVYPVQSGVAQYYWLIESVPEETELGIKYRYVPQWRFKFENSHAAFKATLEKNKVDRTVYNTLGKTFHFQNYNFTGELESTGKHFEEIKKVNTELLAIESIFPQSILNSQDKAYQDYLALKKETEEEITFLTNYRDVLGFFQKEDQSRGKVLELLKLLDDFNTYFGNKGNFPPSIVQESQKVLKTRLEAVAPFFNGLISAKTGWTALDEATYHLASLPKVTTLCQTAGLAEPRDFTSLNRYVSDFNRNSSQLSEAIKIRDEVKKKDRELPQMPANEFYPALTAEVAKAIDGIPQAMGKNTYGFYTNFQCTKTLNRTAKETAAALRKLLQQYQRAQDLVPRLNTLKAEQAYSRMISVLQKNRQLGFLVSKYEGLDDLSIDKQAGQVKTALKAYNWQTAEERLTGLHRDKVFLNPAAIKAKKRTTVLTLEDALYSGIDKISRDRILKFVEERVSELEDVEGLYADSVFMPAYNVRFSSGSQQHLVKKKNELIAMLAKMKDNEFPAKAINLLYKEFMNNPKDNGVLKCRAVVAHGKHYQGKDRKLKIKIAECDPYSAKRIRKVKEYRRVFALPITDNRAKGKNRYFFRLNLDAPSDAKFPVWDVTIKLPKAVAGTAGQEKWYEKMSLNKKLLKNEGRFSISSPSAENNYECQITPVQTRKGKRNILDVFFSHPSFKAYPVSIMMQKPIIKKN